MSGLSPAQIRNRMILSARVIITDHWPRPGKRDWCPICHCKWMCQATLDAYAYLREVDQHRYVPPQMR